MNGQGSALNTVLDECESTNDIARKLAEAGAPHGSWVSTRKQGSGRGRLGRKWESIEGNLFLSVIARISTTELWSWVPMATAVAVAECLKEFNPKLDVEIKWPNDLWLNRQKLGGILCEAMGTKSDAFIVIGLGLNCVRAPQGLDQPAISLSEFLSHSNSGSNSQIKVTADEIRLPLITSVLEILDDLKAHGSQALLELYNRHSVLKPGTPIEWTSNGQTHTGKVEGVGISGELLVLSDQGMSVKLYAEDVKVRLQ